jgi:uncharacterized protein YeaO (DUF488 family)
LNADLWSSGAVKAVGLMIKQSSSTKKFLKIARGLSMITVKRAYESPAASDGQRFLVDRLWPRGVKKEELKLAGWVKEAAPSNELRKWFGHDPEKWDEFKQRYRTELEHSPETWRPLLEAAREGDLILVYSARNTQHNNALVLKAFLEDRLEEESG